MTLKDLGNSIQNLFNQGGNFVNNNVVHPIQQDIYNWGVQHPQQTNQIVNAKLPQPISNAFNTVGNFKIPTQAIPFVGTGLAAMQRIPAMQQAKSPQQFQQAFQSTPTFTPGQVYDNVIKPTWQIPAVWSRSSNVFNWSEILYS